MVLLHSKSKPLNLNDVTNFAIIKVFKVTAVKYDSKSDISSSLLLIRYHF